MTIKLRLFANGSSGLQGEVGPVHAAGDVDRKGNDLEGQLVFGLDADISVRLPRLSYDNDEVEGTVQVGGIVGQDPETTRLRARSMLIAADLVEELTARVVGLEAAGVFNRVDGEDWETSANRYFYILEGIAREYNDRLYPDTGALVPLTEEEVAA